MTTNDKILTDAMIQREIEKEKRRKRIKQKNRKQKNTSKASKKWK